MGTLLKARLFETGVPKNGVYVQFNPNTLKYSAGLERSAHKGVQAKKEDGLAEAPQSQNSPLRPERGSTLSVELFYHTYVSESSYTNLRPEINKIRSFLYSANEEGQVAAASVTFAWGNMTYVGILESFNVTYQMFASDGTPVQATVSITIRGEDPDVRAAAANDHLQDRGESVEYAPLDSEKLVESVAWLFQD